MIKQPILAELKQFIYSLANFRGNPKNVTSTPIVRSSLNLLENLPAAREVVFEYFSLVFDVSVGNFMANMPKDGQATMNEDEHIQDIQETLEALITKGPAAWSPLIANWSLELSGKLSNKYWPGKMDIGAACNLWLNCAAIRCLLGLIASSFRKMNNVEAEVCVETLLATFQKYSPTFDWVVARLGGCFPFKIVSQILQCGLKKFCEDFRCNFDSEIGILDYLAFAHEKDLKKALKELLEDGFNPKNKFHIQVIPYLLQLASCSEVILQAIVTEFLGIYNETYLELITRHTTIWMQNPSFRDMQPCMNNMVLKIKINGSQLLLTVAKLAEKFPWCHDFIECTLQELEHMILGDASCPLLEELSKQESKSLLWKSARSMIFVEQQTAVRLILLVSTQYPHVYHQTISEMLTISYDGNKNGIGPLIRLIGGLSGVLEFPSLRPGLEIVLERILLKIQYHSIEKQEESISTIKNLYTLSMLEKSSTMKNQQNLVFIQPLLNECILKILKILESVLNRISRQSYMDNKILNESPAEHEPKKIKLEKVEKMDVDEEGEAGEEEFSIATESQNQFAEMAHILIKLLNSIEAGSKIHIMGMNETLKLSYLTVKYFFMSLTENNKSVRVAAIMQAFTLLERQCSVRKGARAACLRELIEGALYAYSPLFGGLQDSIEDEELKIDDNEKLILLNRKHGHGTSANRSTLHAGLIGNGLKAENGEYIADNPNPEIQTYYLKALDACCTEHEKVSIDGYAQISLLLVEMVSSDVMYNGFPFPEEEFTKVTMERDLMIRRAFRAHPILWALISLIALHRPALCYSSVLLRGLCASCLHQWRAKNVNKYQQPIANEELLTTTCKLLEVMAMGQLLPPPISNLHLIIKHLDAPEIALVLKECVWNYLKDHVPSPPLFQTDSNGLTWRDSSLAKPLPQYVDALRNIMQKKLPKLGAYYHQMFAIVELEKQNSELPPV